MKEKIVKWLRRHGIIVEFATKESTIDQYSEMLEEQPVEKPKVYCEDCRRWYSTGADQCDIPSCGIYDSESSAFSRAVRKPSSNDSEKYDEEGRRFIRSHMILIVHSSYTTDTIFGKPSKLNKNNDCYFYKEKRR